MLQQGQKDLEEMWGALLRCDWNSLAVVPTDPGVSVREVVAVLQSKIAGSNPVIRVIDARGVDVADGKRLAGQMAADSGRARTVVVVDSLIQSLSGVHLVQGVNAVLLVVRVAALDLESLASTVAIVGPTRVLGSVTAPEGD